MKVGPNPFWKFSGKEGEIEAFLGLFTIRGNRVPKVFGRFPFQHAKPFCIRFALRVGLALPGSS
jgi:hypothetical protein